MEHYKYDLANNIIALASERARQDPEQTDDELFQHYFKSCLAPEFKRKYGKRLKWGPYEEIIAEVDKVITPIS